MGSEWGSSGAQVGLSLPLKHTEKVHLPVSTRAPLGKAHFFLVFASFRSPVVGLLAELLANSTSHLLARY